MATQAETLAAEFSAVNEALIEVVQHCSEEDWRKHNAGEGRSVAVLAHHVALAYGPIAGMAQAVANDQDPHLPPQEMLDEMNARHAVEVAGVGKEETLDLLRSRGANAAAVVQQLSDAQLAKTFATFGGPEWTVAQFIEGAVIGHPKEHMASIRDTLSA